MGIAHLEKVNVDMSHYNPKRKGYFYKISLDFFYWGEKKEIERILQKIRAGEFKDFIGDLERAVNKEGDREPVDMRTEFILSQLTHVLKMLEEEKVGQADTLFNMIESILPEYEDSPRKNEIFETRNIVWDALEVAKNKLKKKNFYAPEKEVL